MPDYTYYRAASGRISRRKLPAGSKSRCDPALKDLYAMEHAEAKAEMADVVKEENSGVLARVKEAAVRIGEKSVEAGLKGAISGLQKWAWRKVDGKR